MSIEVQFDSGSKQLTIRIVGRFDFGAHQEFRKVSENEAKEALAITIDLGRTEYIDSSALGMLLVLRDRVGDSKSAIKIINARPEVKKILQIANFDKLFTLA